MNLENVYYASGNKLNIKGVKIKGYKIQPSFAVIEEALGKKFNLPSSKRGGNLQESIFITGASGFIGERLLLSLKKSHKIYALFRKPQPNLDPQVEQLIGTLDEIAKFQNIIEKCDALYHCAALISFQKKDFDRAYETNVKGTEKVLEVAFNAKVQNVVHLSACAVLGLTGDPTMPLNETVFPHIEKENIYAYTKKCAEDVVFKYSEKGLNVRIANIATVFGEGDKSLNSGSIIQAVYSEKMRFIPPGGTSYVAIGDLIDGLRLLQAKGKRGERYIFAAENLTFRELTNCIATSLKVKPPSFVLPKILKFPAVTAARFIEAFGSFSQGKVNLFSAQIVREIFQYKYFNAQKARDELGWKPKCSLEEAVQQAFTYYLAHNLIKRKEV